MKGGRRKLPSFTFFGGKGGVGKTTCAAIAALTSSRSRRTLLVTTDPASTLSAVLGTSIHATPAAVRGVPRLFAATLDARRAFERWLAPRRELVAAIALRGTYLDEEDVARLLKLSLPGIDEVVGLLEVSRLSGTFDAIVVDTAPTGHTLRLLASPALMGRVAGVLDVLQSHHRAVVGALRGRYDTDAPDALIDDIARDGEALAALLRDPENCAFTWVTLPEPAALEETADALTALDQTGIRVQRLIVNRLTGPPPGGRCAWCDARRRFEARALAPLERRFPDVEIQALPDLVTEPRGIDGLRRAAAAQGAWHGRRAAPPVATRVRVRLDAGDRARPESAVAEAAGSARWLLFGGKGGVGKSTCAAAAAIELAASEPDRRVRLLSVDPAHSLSDIFGVQLADDPRRVSGAPENLTVREIDALAVMDTFRRGYVDAVDAAFTRISRTGGEDQTTFRQLIDLAPPGIDEVIAVAEVASALSDPASTSDVIITDTAPTGHALRLLQTPAVLREWTQALMAILLKYRELVGAGSLAALLVQLSQRLRRLQEVLADPALTRFILVTRPAAVPLGQSAALADALSTMRIRVAAIVVNAGGAGTCSRCRTVAAAERRVLSDLLESRKRWNRCAIIEAPAEIPPPHGARALSAWGTAWRRIA